MDWKTLFLTQQGRIGRRDFWIGFAIVMGASIVLGVIPILGQIIGLLLLWPQICIHAKRLHDFGKPAVLMLIPFGISIVGVILGMVTGAAAVGTSEDGGSTAGLGLAALFFALPGLVGLAFLLWVGLTKSDPGPNQYGAPPEPLIR